ncbi:MAG: helix-turn-helix transcriptional regulator [Erysipelotrichaceae bacterium]|nr:helix-turn-helix transcriptional regulator [Erysipelotrichaceae bacterium]
MARVSYEKLWNKLKENNMQRTDLYKKVKISTNAIAKMGRNEDIRVNILVKICEYFNCKFDDIVEIVQ